MKNNIKNEDEANIKLLGEVAVILAIIPYLLILAVILLKDHINPFENLMIPFLMIVSILSAVILSIRNINGRKGKKLLSVIALGLSILFFAFLIGIYISLIPRSPY